jgi:pyrroline-5-carboxylate reductase
MQPTSLLLVGCGQMGRALCAGWQRAGLALALHIIDPKAEAVAGHAVYAGLADLPESFVPDAVLFAVKPQQLSEILPLYAARFGASAPLYLSIAAGETLAFYRQHLHSARIIRIMPNTPALVGRGMSVLCAHDGTSPADRALAAELFTAVGEIAWLDDEAQMHAATALSGSGPAYVFYFLQCLMEAAQALGLPPALAETLARHTLAGSALLATGPDSPQALRRAVASPGGTTEAALAVFMQDDRWADIIQQAMQKAAERSKQLGQDG